MKMAALSEASGVAVPTIKYYLREGLIAPGARTAPNQASYTVDHVRRLRLIRSLVTVGDLPLDTVRSVLDALDDTAAPTHDVLGVVHSALAFRGSRSDRADLDEQVDETAAFLRILGWNVKADGPAVYELAQALATLRQLGWDVTTDVFRPYAHAADRLAAWELDRISDAGTRTEVLEGVVVGTVIFENVLLAFRRLAEEHHSANR